MWDNLFSSWVETFYTINDSRAVSESWFLFETAFLFSKDALWYSYSTNYTFIFTAKLATCLVFLSAIRGGVPRYRYDFLTKMGWIKFLGYMLSVFLTVFILFVIW